MICRNTPWLQLLFVFVILTVIMMAGCAAKRELLEVPEKGVALEYRMPEGQVLRYRVLNEFAQNLEMSGQSVEVQMNRGYEFSIESNGLKGNDHQLEITIDSMDMNVVSPQGEISPNMSSIVGKSFDMTLSPLGKELDVSGARSVRYEVGPGEKRSIISDFQTLFPDLAGRPVKVGDTWTTQDTLAIEEGDSQIFITVESLNTLEGFETVDGLECARITAEGTGTLEGQGQQQGADLTFEGELEGTDTWYFAHKEGLLVKILTEASIGGTVTVGGPQSMTIPMVQEIRIKTELIR